MHPRSLAPSLTLRDRARLAVVVLTLQAAALVPVAEASGWTPAQQGADETDVIVVADPRVHPALLAVPVEGPELTTASRRHRATEARLADAQRRGAEAREALVVLESAQRRLQHRLHEAERRQAKSERRLAELAVALRRIAVADYVRGGTGTVSDPTVDLTDLEANHRRQVLVTAVVAEQRREAAAHREALNTADALATRTRVELDEIESRRAATAAARDRADADRTQAEAALVADAQAVADARLLGTVAGTDVPFVALDAYVRAATATAASQPACGLSWTLLAGIGRVESRHGRFGNARVDAEGRSEPRIFGIPLDGRPGVAAIPDTDGGALDGDPVWDRAVGPMQFIPGTWRRWQRDGDLDGVADPHDLHDAALAAAAYLCGAARGLGDEAGARRALLAYNASTAYGTDVLGHAAGYAEVIVLAGLEPPPPP